MSTETAPLAGGVLVGFDGSPDAAGAIDLGARLLPGRDATVAHLWAPPYARPELRARVRQAGSVREMIEMLEREAQAEAERVAANGVTLARAAGWQARALVHRSYGGEGLELAALAEELHPAALVVGSRGLSGVRAVLGSVSDEAVHSAPVPVLVVPGFVASEARAATAAGPVLVGDDGSDGAARAAEAARELFAGRQVQTATVEDAATARGVADRLMRQAREHGAAGVVVGSRGRSAAREILLGSVALAVLHHADRPVLAVPARS
jgi:nucleotide-binding universal stress UspA family protein